MTSELAAEPRANILLVEPNMITRKLITGILTKNGFRTFEAANGDEAVAFLSKLPDLVLLDVEDGSADHLGFVRKLQKDHARMPLIAMLELADREGIQKSLGLERLSFIEKPVMPDALLAGIETQLQWEASQKNGTALTGTAAEVDEQRRAFMRRAIDLSQQKMDENCGGPFGAVIVKGGKIIGEGWNCVTSTNDPTAHAEVTAIRNAAASLKDFNLAGCEIYTSCEPCPMCLSAIYWARLDKIFYANMREDAERIGFDDAFLYAEVALPENKRSLPSYRLLREEAKIVFENWMKKQDKTAY
ncbi:MAG: deaminase [Micavibrio sp.]|nr:deaminase [Micavibrio sp.]